MAAKFGTSGLRGLVEDLTDGTSERHVIGFARHLLSSGQIQLGDKVFIGQDLRASSPKIAQQTAQGLSHAGLIPISCGDLPTPALADYAMKQNAASIMITGSHIPADRNGIKFYLPDGEIAKPDELAIRSHADLVQDDELGSSSNIDMPNEKDQVLDQYFKRYENFLPENALKHMKLGLYEHSSVARDYFKTLLEHFGAEVVSLARSETFVPVDTEAVSAETCEMLFAWSLEHKFDAIISTDGDGDRPLLADEQGICVKGDVLGLITSMFIDADAIITPVSSNSGIEKVQKADVIRTRIGSPYVIEGIVTSKAKGAKTIAAFEANGGFLLGSDISVDGRSLSALPTRDCVLPILAVLASATQNAQSVSNLVAGLKLPITQSGRIENLPTEHSLALIKSLVEDEGQRNAFFAKFGKVAHVDSMDGLRIGLDNGSTIHLRPSGNAPEMRCYVEAHSLEKADLLLSDGITHIQNALNGKN